MKLTDGEKTKTTKVKEKGEKGRALKKQKGGGGNKKTETQKRVNKRKKN
jgi:hypothetical protein